MNITNTCCKHCNAKVCNLLAFLRICTFACTDNAVFLTADWTNFSFKRNAENITSIYKSCCLSNVFFDWIMWTVKHYWWETCIDASLSSFKWTMVEVESNRNSNSEFFNHTLNHSDNCLITAHILACTLWYTENYRWIAFLSCKENSLCPFKVVDIELTNCILSFSCLCKHFFSWN